MRKILLSSAAAIGLVFGGAAASSAQTEFTATEEASLFNVMESPVAIELDVGSEVPAAVQLHDAPGDFQAASNAKKYKYTRRGNKVYVVDMKTRKVVRVITKKAS